MSLTHPPPFVSYAARSHVTQLYAFSPSADHRSRAPNQRSQPSQRRYLRPSQQQERRLPHLLPSKTRPHQHLSGPPAPRRKSPPSPIGRPRKMTNGGTASARNASVEGARRNGRRTRIMRQTGTSSTIQRSPPMSTNTCAATSAFAKSRTGRPCSTATAGGRA